MADNKTMRASFLHVPGGSRQQVLQYRMRGNGEDAGCRLPVRACGLRR